MAADIKAFAARGGGKAGRTKAPGSGEMDLTAHYHSKKKDVGSKKKSRALRKAYMMAVLAAKRLGRPVDAIVDPSKTSEAKGRKKMKLDLAGNLGKGTMIARGMCRMAPRPHEAAAGEGRELGLFVVFSVYRMPNEDGEGELEDEKEEEPNSADDIVFSDEEGDGAQWGEAARFTKREEEEMREAERASWKDKLEFRLYAPNEGHNLVVSFTSDDLESMLKAEIDRAGEDPSIPATLRLKAPFVDALREEKRGGMSTDRRVELCKAIIQNRLRLVRVKSQLGQHRGIFLHPTNRYCLSMQANARFTEDAVVVVKSARDEENRCGSRFCKSLIVSLILTYPSPPPPTQTNPSTLVFLPDQSTFNSHILGVSTIPEEHHGGLSARRRRKGYLGSGRRSLHLSHDHHGGAPARDPWQARGQVSRL